MLNRRRFFLATTGLLATGFAALGARRVQADDFPLTLTDAEWQARLSPAQYAVLRDHKTERAFSNTLMGEQSPLLSESRAGTYLCAGCAQPLYRSETKYDSRTGWPSYWEAIEGAIGTQTDRSFFMVRTEAHCSNCGGHQGHIFDDGPQPTGKRHCINGLAMLFIADGSDIVEGHPVPA